MSVRGLDEGPSSGYSTEISQIESIADTKGVEIEDIEVDETETESGNTVARFRIYHTRDDGDGNPIAVQASKVQGSHSPTGQFRNEVQNALSQLKNYLTTGSTQSPELEEIEEELEQESDRDERSSRRSRRPQRSRNESDVGFDLTADGVDVVVRVDAEEYDDIDDFVESTEQYQDLEARVERIENALDGLSDTIRVPGFSDE